MKIVLFSAESIEQCVAMDKGHMGWRLLVIVVLLEGKGLFFIQQWEKESERTNRGLANCITPNG